MDNNYRDYSNRAPITYSSADNTYSSADNNENERVTKNDTNLEKSSESSPSDTSPDADQISTKPTIEKVNDLDAVQKLNHSKSEAKPEKTKLTKEEKAARRASILKQLEAQDNIENKSIAIKNALIVSVSQKTEIVAKETILVDVKSTAHSAEMNMKTLEEEQTALKTLQGDTKTTEAVSEAHSIAQTLEKMNKGDFRGVYLPSKQEIGHLLEDAHHLLQEKKITPEELRSRQHDLIYTTSEGGLYVPSHLEADLKSGPTTIVNHQGKVSSHDPKNLKIKVLTDDEHTLFKASFSVGLQKVIDAAITVNVKPNEKHEHKKDSGSNYLNQQMAQVRKHEVKVAQAQNRARDVDDASRLDPSESTAEIRNKEAAKLEEILEMKFKIKSELDKKDDFKLTTRKDTAIVIDRNNKALAREGVKETNRKNDAIEMELQRECAIKTQIINEEFVDSVPQEQEIYRKEEISFVKDCLVNVADKVNDKELSNEERKEALKEVFRLVSIGVVKIRGTKTTSTHIPQAGHM